jgi:hypothetical protein
VNQTTDTRVNADPALAAMHSLARELDLPLEHVARVYREEASKIAAEARIKTFVSVIVTSRVHAELRRQQSSG